MTLSIFRNGKPPAVVVASPTFPTTDNPVAATHYTFEVFEEDASPLRELIGRYEYYVIDSNTHFFGKLEELTQCEPRVGRPTLLGTITVFADQK